MSTNRDIINLQNAPTTGVELQPVSLSSSGNRLSGRLYLPATSEALLPSVVVTGAWTTVKEQMAGTYARELARRGFAALAFDFTGWGESEGTPRYVEDPERKTRDIHAAVEFLLTVDGLDQNFIAGLGVCASAGYMAAAVADHPGLKRLALVAPWLHDPAMAGAVYGGAETVQALISSSENPEAEGAVLTAASETDETSPMYQAPYYTEEDRGLIDAYDNKFSVLSWKPWLTYDAQLSADRLTKPVLMVVSPSIALPGGVAAYEKRTNAEVTKVELGENVSQFDFYDDRSVVMKAADAVAEFLGRC